MILIIQNCPNDPPSYLATWLSEHGIPYSVFHSSHAHTLPKQVSSYRAMAVLGGPMSVMDKLDGCEHTATLIRQALNQNIPVLGHCLGGQLLSYAAGGTVSKTPVPEIGWHTIDIANTPFAHNWFGRTGAATVYEWHGDTYSLPPHATHLASSAFCAQQAFSLGDHHQHLGMQFHIEVDAAKIHAWAQLDGNEIDCAHQAGFIASVQTTEQQLADNALYLSASQSMAAHIYARWLMGAQYHMQTD